MRKFTSILKATALEVLSEPLSLLILLTALVMTVFAPAFHYHQFGEPTRMARDAGFSALFACGGVLAVFATIRAFRREVETGTMEMALAHPVSRGGFFFAKAAGAAVAYLVFALIVFGTQLAIVWGAAAGGALAMQTGGLARVFAPALAAGVAVILVPLVVAAALNRLARFRFVLTCFVVAFVLALLFGGAAFALAPRLLAPYFAVAALLVCPALVLLAASAAFAMRFKANAAASLVGLVFAAMLPFVGNYYLSDALSNGGSVPLSYLLLAVASALPLAVAFFLFGFRRDRT